MSTSVKTCFKCGDALPLTAFYAHPKMRDGTLNKCRACTLKDAREYRAANLDLVRLRDRKRSRSPERKAKRLEYQKRLRARYPERARARNAINRALRTGTLTRQPCSLCGSHTAEAHHADYGKPLDVAWLCFRCHRLTHSPLLSK